MILDLMIAMLIISSIIASILEFMKTRKLRKLSYPLITIYFFVGIPLIDKVINNKMLSMCFTVLSFIITMVFLYNELKKNNEEKNLPH